MEPKEDVAPLQSPPEKPAEVLPQSGEVLIAGNRIARLGDRLIALILDTILLGAAFALLGMLTASRLGGVTERGFSMEGKPALIAISLTVIFGFLYYWVFEGVFGATLGKAIIGIQVRKKDGTRCGLKSSLIRNIFRIIDGIGVYIVGFLIALFSKLRQRLGDHLANTVVVETKSGKIARALFIIIWLAAIIGGIWFAYKIHSELPKSVIIEPLPASEPAPLFTAGDLRVVNFNFLQSKDGTVIDEALYKSGEKVYTKYNVIGYTTDSEGKFDLVFNVAALDPNGLPIYAPWKDEIKQTPEKSTTPVAGSYNFDLPFYSPPGNYRIRIRVHDAVKNTDSELTKAFRVESEPVAPAAKLEFRDCKFSLSKDGPLLSPALIEPGDTIYSACKVAGMQFREDRPNIHIALQVIGSDGRSVLDKPDFFNDTDEYVYHPPAFFEKISAWITLPTGSAKGSYTWRYIMTDRIANSNVNYEAKFEVR